MRTDRPLFVRAHESPPFPRKCPWDGAVAELQRLAARYRRIDPEVVGMQSDVRLSSLIVTIPDQISNPITLSSISIRKPSAIFQLCPFVRLPSRTVIVPSGRKTANCEFLWVPSVKFRIRFSATQLTNSGL
jgi:hypothetical protein